ncbi:MAG TPA: glycoside hydrolase family 3 N-terminal domain-containing protein [Spirochaetales bacterium]|nr:glycoside hydrolase family 3 N-terminal domain-containing protein [Spirochaetales bacterium]
MKQTLIQPARPVPGSPRRPPVPSLPPFARLALPLALAVSLALAACACSPGEGGTRGATNAPSPHAVKPAPPARPDPAAPHRARARAIAETLGDADLVGQLLMVGVDGTGSLPRSSRSLLETARPGAVVLFGFNADAGPLALGRFLGELQDAAAFLPAPILAAIDHEGGAVQRFKSGVTRLPWAAELGAKGSAAAEAAGRIAGSELRALGVALNLAPVVESSGAGQSSFLGRRAFSADPAESGKLAGAFASGLASAGVGAVLKHWPGSSELDPHLGLPTLDAATGELAARYERPFADAFAAGPAAVMLSHVMLPSIDPVSPVTWSKAAIARLRAAGFRGLVLTDDVAMKASLELLPAGEAALAAVAAGADLVMVSGGPYTAEVVATLRAALADGRLPRERAVEACANALAWKFALELETERDAAVREARLASFPDLVASHAGLLD